MNSTKPKETAAFICSRDTLDGAYPPLILAINAARAGMDTKVFHLHGHQSGLQRGR